MLDNKNNISISYYKIANFDGTSSEEHIGKHFFPSQLLLEMFRKHRLVRFEHRLFILEQTPIHNHFLQTILHNVIIWNNLRNISTKTTIQSSSRCSRTSMVRSRNVAQFAFALLAGCSAVLRKGFGVSRKPNRKSRQSPLAEPECPLYSNLKRAPKPVIMNLVEYIPNPFKSLQF